MAIPCSLLRSGRLALLAFGVAFALAGCDREQKSAAVVTPSKSVSVVTVDSRVIEGGLIASGTLIPREDTAVFSDLSGYRVAQVLVDEGAWVTGGQPLAQLDDTLLRSQVEQQAALATQLEVQAQRAEAEAARVKDLDNASVFAKEQIEARRFAAKAARAQADAQAASARDLRTREAKMTIRAPYAGLVIERNCRVGDMGGGGNPWFRIAKDGLIELAADVSETALPRLQVGAAAKVILADGTEVDGTVRLVSPRVDANTKLGKVRIELPVTESIRAGGFARARFTGVSVASAVVPETAVLYDADGAAVMLVGSDDTISRVPVVTGERGSGYVELVTGPPVGSRVVAKAASMLVTGDKVTPILETAAAPAPGVSTAPSTRQTAAPAAVPTAAAPTAATAAVPIAQGATASTAATEAPPARTSMPSGAATAIAVPAEPATSPTVETAAASSDTTAATAAARHE
ncbi:MAG TPA: efflux RND transporter periplasmic adaptor subunit [Pseudomonadales bacterium]|nr:efflux RND transporter periplasmic adaptor subunit [Pseudomonadales bacterium]